MKIISKNKSAKCSRCGKAVPVIQPEIGGQIFRITSAICDDCYDIQEREEARRADERHANMLTTIKRDYKKYAIKNGLPPIYHGASFDSMIKDTSNQTAIEAAYKFLDDPVRFLLLYGSAGRGKSWVAAAVFRELITTGVEARWCRAVDMLDSIRESIRQNDSRGATDQYRNVRVLVIDDLGSERATDWSIEQIYSLIDYRYSHRLGTIITSNSSGAEMARVFGTRVMSRIRHAGDVVEIGGGDRRLPPKKSEERG